MWDDVARFVADELGIKEGDFRFYGKNYGWALRFRKGGKALVSLYPRKDGFTAQIIISSIDVEKAYNLSLGENARKVLVGAHEFKEGRWLFLRVESEQDVRDVQQLLKLKSRPSTK